MKHLNEDLKENRFSSLYLLYGEETYLKKQYKEKLIQGILPDGNQMNFSYFEGKQIDFTKVMEISETLPFFSETRLIVVENSGVFKKSAGEWAEYVGKLPETTKMIFLEEEVDKRGKLYKVVSKQGRVVELKRQEQSVLQKWILSRLKKEGKRITQDGMYHLFEKVGTDMEALFQEVEKLISYKWTESEITKADVEEVVCQTLEDKVFSMVEALVNKNRKQALLFYKDLLGLKVAPMKILSVIQGQCKRMYEVKSLWEEGVDKGRIATTLGIPPFAVDKVLRLGRNYKKSQIKGMLEEGLEIEEQMKVGHLNDRMGVEIFIVKHSGA